MPRQQSNGVMARAILIPLSFGIILSLGLYCSLEKPTAVDGTFAVKIVVLDTTNLVIRSLPVAGANVQLKCDVYKISVEQLTNSLGEAEFTNLLAGTYEISAIKTVTTENQGQMDTLVLIGNSEVQVDPSNPNPIDTVRVGFKPADKLVINEIYYSGVEVSDQAYLDDQFVELYNPTADSINLKGYIIARGASNTNYIGSQLVECVYAYQFTDDAFAQPHKFIVIAQDAIDHRSKAPGSIDLSGADYECFSGNDVDNPEVPNLVPVNQNSAVNDFMINNSHDIVLLIKPKEKFQTNRLDNLLFRVADVVDGVKYTREPDNKFIDPAIDRGYAGKDIERFSGKSIERHHPVTGDAGYDVNNSFFDFITISRPTPKTQHVSAQSAHP